MHCNSQKFHTIQCRLTILVYLVCSVTCLYNLVQFMQHYFSYSTSVDADVVIEDIPQVPGITICYNEFLLDLILCRKSKDYCEIKGRPKSDDALAYISLKNNHVDMVSKCNFRSFTNEDSGVALNKCISSWIFNGYEPCNVINSAWAKPITNKKGFGEFMFQIKPHEPHKGSRNILGVDIAVHSPVAVPTRHVRSYFLTFGCIYKINFKTTVVFRLPPPFQTKCYLYESKKSANGRLLIAGQEACFYDCLWERVNSTCGCIPAHTPFIDNFRACNATLKESCGTYIDYVKTICNSLCPVACRTDYYDFGLTKIYTFTKNERHTFTEVYHELRGNAVIQFRHKPQFKPMELFSYVGGYLGIWLGMSVPKISDIIANTLIQIYKRTRKSFHRKNTRINK